MAAEIQSSTRGSLFHDHKSFPAPNFASLVRRANAISQQMGIRQTHVLPEALLEGFTQLRVIAQGWSLAFGL